MNTKKQSSHFIPSPLYAIKETHLEVGRTDALLTTHTHQRHVAVLAHHTARGLPFVLAPQYYEHAHDDNEYHEEGYHIDGVVVPFVHFFIFLANPL